MLLSYLAVLPCSLRLLCLVYLHRRFYDPLRGVYSQKGPFKNASFSRADLLFSRANRDDRPSIPRYIYRGDVLITAKCEKAARLEEETASCVTYLNYERASGRELKRIIAVSEIWRN